MPPIKKVTFIVYTLENKSQGGADDIKERSPSKKGTSFMFFQMILNMIWVGQIKDHLNQQRSIQSF